MNEKIFDKSDIESECQNIEPQPSEIHGYRVIQDYLYGTEGNPKSFVLLDGISQNVGFFRPISLELDVSNLCENPDDPDDDRWYNMAVKSLIVTAQAAWLNDAMTIEKENRMFQEYDLGYYRWDFNGIIMSPGSIQEIPLSLWYCDCDGYLIMLPEQG